MEEVKEEQVFRTNYEECVKCNHRRHKTLFEPNSVVCTPCRDYKQEELDE